MSGRVMVIGLDSATFKLIEPFMCDGYLPNLDNLTKNGVSCILKSTIPPISPPAWTTFLTGMNPGKHGIFQFVDMDVSDYNFLSNRIINSTLFAGNTFIDFISSNGLKVGIVKIPFTYPPWKVNGFMIAGEPSPDWQKAHTYPPELSDELGKVNYGSGSDFIKYSVEELLKHLQFDSNVRTMVACDMMGKEQYDFFMVVHNIIDAACHRLWKYTDPSCPNYKKSFAKYSDVIRDVYIEADKSIGKILENMGDGTTVFIMSDHGAARKPLHFFNINAWLAEKGYLQFNESKSIKNMLFSLLTEIKYVIPPVVRHMISHTIKRHFMKRVSGLQTSAANIDWCRTKAYSVDLYTTIAGIALNLNGRQKFGIVEQGRESELMCEEIKSNLLGITDPKTGIKVIENVFRREDIFRGPSLEKMPELIVQFNGDYQRAKRQKLPLFSDVNPSDFDYQSGDHDEDGIFIAYGKNIKKGMKLDYAHIQDMAPTILYAMGLPVPDDMDGKVMLDTFEESFTRQNTVGTVKLDKDKKTASRTLTEDESDKIKEQLKGLGYM
ncbi:MAG: hypothetical protein A2W05_06475 [Candidatus Schekmanbacteria bacterium RBG_16_38_10]|uniref:Nucleotide pyrophosphatase n=1 Tax=Candidatus Schekmanbacteria bacterium RBG_16_38_10 TaxID=1817879 RepID=A0A1F7RTK4_9BACT|nr:MAG: hypothetical protein A2W05_06475 [Candidatus Schekmanbacteria bacterium RBG_16_38_10]